MVSEEMSLQGAARLLSRSNVTGAPVIDRCGRCVGVISATDFLRWAEKNPKPGPSQPVPANSVCAWQIVETESLPAEAVRNYVTSDLVTTTLGARIGEIAQMMLDAHIHRVIVVDAERQPVGIVSVTDLLAALARADVVRRVAAGVESGDTRHLPETLNR